VDLAPGERLGAESAVPHDTPRIARQDPRDVSELKHLRTRHPELADAIDMQIELVELHRRIQARVRTPLVHLDAARLERGERLLEFDHVPVNWSELRLAFRQTIDILRRFDTLSAEDGDTLQALERDGPTFETAVRDYYERTPRPDLSRPAAHGSAMLDAVLALALRPFLARCAEVGVPQLGAYAWPHGWCPICGAEPDFAVLNGSGRQLVCGRCLARWPFEASACPFCPARGPGAITSFASRDGAYRVSGCNACRKYLKAVDTRHAPRACMPLVDTIATLPLDAAALQKGYDG
jgi:hypothetical protein